MTVWLSTLAVWPCSVVTVAKNAQAEKSRRLLRCFIFPPREVLLLNENAVTLTRVARGDGNNLSFNSEIVKKYLIIALLDFVTCALT